MIFKLSNFSILSSGADGGHNYISTKVEHKGELRKIIILFKNRSDEKNLADMNEVSVQGRLIDEGLQQSLMLLDAEIVDR